MKDTLILSKRLTKRIMCFVSEDYICSIFTQPSRSNFFVDLKGKTDVLIPTFLTLKKIGVNKNRSVDYNEDAAREAVFLLNCPYLSTEPHPENKYLINPFSRSFIKTTGAKKYWRSESLDRYVKLGSHGLCNNYVGGGTIWDRILATSEKSPIRFRVNYIDEIKKACGISYNNRIDITKLAGWCFREVSFDKGLSKNELTQSAIELFLGTFNITNEEMKALFEITGDLIRFSSNLLNMSNVRANCFNFDPPGSLISNKLIDIDAMSMDRRHYFMSSNPKLEKIIEILREKKQLVLYGPPGVGKTWIAKQIAKCKDWKKTEIVQFHPSYGFEQFIGGYFPVSESDPEGKDVSIAYREGILLRFIELAEKDPALLIIDEINRGNLSKILGEAIMALDRGYEVNIGSHPKEKKLILPDNLHIIGTMNSTDRSIAFVDFALRRRFAFVRLDPDAEVIREHYKRNTRIESDGKSFDLIDLFVKINERIACHAALGREFQIGHSYYMLQMSDLSLFYDSFLYFILPLVEEYSYGNLSVLTDILGERLPYTKSEDDFLDAVIEYLES